MFLFAKDQKQISLRVLLKHFTLCTPHSSNLHSWCGMLLYRILRVKDYQQPTQFLHIQCIGGQVLQGSVSVVCFYFLILLVSLFFGPYQHKHTFVCVHSGITINPAQPCGLGHYCPLQTPTPDRYPCPAGTYTNRSDLHEESQCTICPQGYYCNGKGYF